MHNIGEGINNICKVIIGIQLIAILIITVFQVILRRLDFSISWATEFSTLLFIWMTLIGAAIGAKYCMHIGVDAVKDRLKGTARKYFLLFSYVVLIVGIIVLVMTGFLYTVVQIPHLTTSMPISVSWFFCSIPICGIVMLYHTIVQALEIICFGDILPVLEGEISDDGEVDL